MLAGLCGGRCDSANQQLVKLGGLPLEVTMGSRVWTAIAGKPGRFLENPADRIAQRDVVAYRNDRAILSVDDVLDASSRICEHHPNVAGKCLADGESKALVACVGKSRTNAG